MRIIDWSSDVCSSDLTAHRITSPWKWRHLKSVIVPSVQSPPSMLKLHDFCNRAVLPGPSVIGVRELYWPTRTLADQGIAAAGDAFHAQIGSASCRERVCQYV